MSRDITTIPPLPPEQRVRYGPEPSQFFDVWPAKGSVRGVAVMIHGGFWRSRYDLTHASHLCNALAAEGLSVANLEYRRVGEPGGGWPGSFNDVKLAVHAAAKHLGGAPVVLGHSAGGHLALLMASEALQLRGVVALAPVADLRLAHQLKLSNGAVQEFLGVDPDQHPEILRDADPLQHATRVRAFLVHGLEDEIVPLQLSRNYVEARSADRTAPELVTMEGANHFDVIDPEAPAFSVVRECVRKLL